MNIKIFQLFMLATLFFGPHTVMAVKKDPKSHHTSKKHKKHKHRSHRKHRDLSSEESSDTATLSHAESIDSEQISTSIANSDLDGIPSDKDFLTNETVESESEELEFATKKHKKKKKKKHSTPSHSESSESSENSDDIGFVIQSPEASESEENEFITYVRSEEGRKEIKETAKCCAGFGMGIFKRIRNKKNKKGDEPLDAFDIIEAVFGAAEETMNKQEKSTRKARKRSGITSSTDHVKFVGPYQIAIDVKADQYNENDREAMIKRFEIDDPREVVSTAHALFRSVKVALAKNELLVPEDDIKHVKRRHINAVEKLEKEADIVVTVRFRNPYTGHNERKECHIFDFQAGTREMSALDFGDSEGEGDPDS